MLSRRLCLVVPVVVLFDRKLVSSMKTEYFVRSCKASTLCLLSGQEGYDPTAIIGLEKAMAFNFIAFYIGFTSALESLQEELVEKVWVLR